MNTQQLSYVVLLLLVLQVFWLFAIVQLIMLLNSHERVLLKRKPLDKLN